MESIKRNAETFRPIVAVCGSQKCRRGNCGPSSINRKKRQRRASMKIGSEEYVIGNF